MKTLHGIWWINISWFACILHQARTQEVGMIQVLANHVSGGAFRWESKVLTTTLSWSLVCLRSGPQWIETEDVHKLEFCGIRIFVRHVNFIWFVFRHLRFLPVRFIWCNSYCTSKIVMKHKQKLDWRSKVSLVLWLLEVYVCWFLDWIERSSRLRSPLSVE
jgi:hypothetical protein